MSVVKFARVGSFMRSFKCQNNPAAVFIPRRNEWVYSKKEGIPRDVITFLTKDYDTSWKGIKSFMESSRWTAIKEDHKFIAERHRVLGPDLATAHFMVKRGAKAKFYGRNTWFEKDKEGNVYLPNQFLPGMHLEAVDASGLQMSYVAFDNMIQLEKLRYLNFSNCINFDDWCLARMYQFQDSLEFLDISGCREVTENGLACLYNLKNLKGLKLSGLPNVDDMGLIVLLLEEALPDCTIFGIDPEQLKLPGGDGEGQLLDGRLKAITGGNSSTTSDIR